MSDRRRVPRIPRRVRPVPTRRRSLLALGAVAALVALAGAIGSQHSGETTHATSAPTAGATAQRSSVAPTTADIAIADVAEGGDLVTAAGGGSTASPSVDSKSTIADTTTGSGTGLAPLQAKIIRTGSVDLVVKRGTFAEALSRLTTTATGVGGFVSASETSQLGSDPRGTITLRVPAKDFDRVLARIDSLGTIAAVTTGSQDVTGEYTDVAARINALKDEREQISLVLSRAQSIPDILSVRDRLSAVQGELEQLQGRQQVLDDQTSLSTIAVSLSEKGARTVIGTRPAPERTGFAKLWHDAAHRFGEGARSIAIGFAAMGPWLILALVLWLPARWLWRRGTVVADAAVPSPVPARVE